MFETPAPAARRFCWRYIAQRTMRTLLVVILSPGFDLALCMAETCEPVRIQTFIPQPAVEAFYVGVLYRLAWLDELQPHTAFFAPCRQCPTAELRPIAPREPRCYGSEFTSQAMDLWAYRNGVRIDFSRPGKPTDNAFVESFNGTLRAECLDVHWFASIAEAKQLIEGWRREYNESRPHRALGEQTPSEFASQFAAQGELTGLQETENSP